MEWNCHRVPVYRQQIYDSTEGRCWYCGYALCPGRFTVDHKVPRRRGGTDALDNLVPACMACNQAKGHKTVEAFRVPGQVFYGEGIKAR